MSETQSDTHRSLPGSQKLGVGGAFSRERKGVEAWIKLRRKWEKIVNRRKGGRKGRIGRGREHGRKQGGQEDRGEEGKGRENQDKVTRYYPQWPQVPSNFE